jgi:hypothetical protein
MMIGTDVADYVIDTTASLAVIEKLESRREEYPGGASCIHGRGASSPTRTRFDRLGFRDIVVRLFDVLRNVR